MVIAITLSVVGCAEFRNRGGLVDKIEDAILFRADTKGHRLIRSYVMATALVSIARYSGIKKEDQGPIAHRIESTISIVYEAYKCLYDNETDCIFFDEMMSRLDYNIFKLAILVLYDPESRELLSDARDRLVGVVPIIGPLLRSATRAVEAVADAATATQQASQIIDGLSRLGELALRTGGRLLPLYRDAIEMDMVIVLDTFAKACDASLVTAPSLKRDQVYRKLLDKKQALPLEISEACDHFEAAYILYNHGNGDLGKWRAYLAGMNGVLQYIAPDKTHFATVSEFLWNSCYAAVGPAINASATDPKNANLRACRIYLAQITPRFQSVNIMSDPLDLPKATLKSK
jgi:hypothetical protein